MNERNLMEVVLNMLRERKERQRKQQEVERKIKAAGFTDKDWCRITMFQGTFDDQAGSVAYCLAVACKTGDRDAATLGLMHTKYLAERATWIETVCRTAGVDLGDLDMQPNMGDFRIRMTHAQGIFSRVLAGEDLSEHTVGELTTVREEA